MSLKQHIEMHTSVNIYFFVITRVKKATRYVQVKTIEKQRAERKETSFPKRLAFFSVFPYYCAIWL